MPGINLGPATDFARELRGSSDFRAFVENFGDLAQKRMQDALEAPPERRIDQTAYVRALLDVWTALQAVIMDIPQARVRGQPALDRSETRTRGAVG